MEAAGKRFILHKSKTDLITVWNLSDIHLGSKACALDKAKEDIERIRTDPFSFWVGGGDYADYIGFQDKRFDPDAVAENIKVADLGRMGKKLTEEVRDLFSPIKHKCLGLLFGNHEKRYQQWQEQTHLHSWLCTELEVPNLGYSAIFDVAFYRWSKTKSPKIVYELPNPNETQTQSFRFFVHHGAGFAMTKAGKLKRLMDFMTSFDAEIYMVGHVHDQEGVRMITVGADTYCTNLVQKHKLGVISGSYLKTYAQGVTTYGEQRGYAPTTLGAATVEINPHQHTFKGEI